MTGDGSATERTARPSSGAPFPLPGRFAAVVFDMDGLLLDSEDVWHLAERDLMANHGAELTAEDRLASVGRAVDDVMGWYAQRIGWGPEREPELRAELVEIVVARYATIELMPGARDLLAALHGRVRLGLASNTDRALIERALVATGLESTFDATVSAQDVARPKPAPELYLLACARLGVSPGDAVALEDSTAGVVAAKAAGMACIAVPHVAGVDVSAADQIVGSLAQLIEGR